VLALTVLGLTFDRRRQIAETAGLLVQAEFPADMGELHRVGKSSVGHHRAQRGQTGLREEDARLPDNRGVQAHKPALDERLGGRRQLGLACLGSSSPGPEWKPIGGTRLRREENVEFTTYVVALPRREGRGRRVLKCVHGRHVGTVAALTGPVGTQRER